MRLLLSESQLWRCPETCDSVPVADNPNFAMFGEKKDYYNLYPAVPAAACCALRRSLRLPDRAPFDEN